MSSVLPVISDLYPRFGCHGFLSGLKAIQIFLLFNFCLLAGVLKGQTDFAPGEIMFIGYESLEQDTFSIVLLTDVLANTVIYITDRGWSNTSGFRTGTLANEGVISLTFNSNYSCGKEIIFGKNSVPIPDTWEAKDVSGNLIGSVVITSGTNGPNLDSSFGDQLFIYQSPTPTAANQSSFITAIHMDGAWSNATADNNSAKPNGLEDNEVVVFNSEYDVAKYDCEPKVGTGSYLQSQITNENPAGLLRPDNSNNWYQEGNTAQILKLSCPFCCTSTELIAPDFVSTNQSFTITIDGTLPAGESWQLYTLGCGVGSPVQTTMSNSFTITAPSTEGNINYYINSSGNSGSCPGLCVYVSICVENTPFATCTICTANPETCGDCLMPDIIDNPDLDSGCYAIKLIFILDESGSIGGNAGDVEDGVLAFLNALNGQDIQLALIEFACEARVVTPYTTINDNLIFAMEGYFNNTTPFNGQTYNPINPGGTCAGTNWHDAMIKADGLDPADMLMFFTDGVPTGWNTVWNACGDGTTTQTPEIVNPAKLANKFKSEDTHMFMLGVGTGIDAYNLQLMSGFTEYEPGVNNIGTADYSIGNFADLAEDLEAFVNELCATPLDLDKQLLGAVCDGIQQFMFIIHNPGEESAATIIEVIDSFPSGYTNIMHTYPSLVKICYGAQCADQGEGFPVPNGFIWTTTALAPGDSDTLIVSAEVVPGGIYTNIAWAQGDNTALVSDTVAGNLLTDDLPPVVSCPGNVTIECSESSLPDNTGAATGTDPDGSTPTITFSDQITPGSCDGEYTIHRTWTATDGCANSDTCTQLIFVEDTTSPQIDCATDITIQCGDNTLPANTGNTDVDDNCDDTPVLTYDDVTMEESCGSTIERTWLAEDDCGNTSTCVQIITIDDNTLPVITCPADVTIACTDGSLPANTGGSATATDNCDPDPVISYTDVISPGDCQEGQVITRTWNALDECGNSSTCNQIIFVIDNSPPEITCPANVTIECTASTLPANTGSPTTTDNCSTLPDVTYTNLITNGSCPQEYTITRTWIAEDGCGNSSTCVQTIFVDDSTPPLLSCPANITITCTASTLPDNTGNATSTDNCDLTTLITYSDITVSGSCAQEYTITRTWMSTDDCGNSTSCNQTIFIDDSTSPLVTCPPDITIQCTASTLPANTGSATSTDNCDLSPVILHADVTVAGTCPQEYTITRTWTSTDACGNSTTCNQLITIEDTTSPDITCPADVTIECTGNTLPDSTGTPGVVDSCDPAPEFVYNDVTISGPTPNGYTIQRTWTTTDSCGNTSSCLQIITVENPIDPEMNGLAFDTICSGQSVTFVAEEQGLPGEMHQWMFGSGSTPPSATGTGPHNVVYNYDATNGSVGASVLLTVSIDGCASVTDTVANVHVNAIPNPAINASTANLCYFRNRTFSPVAAEMPGYTYEWDFGAGASIPPISGYGPHVVSYSTTGPKTVRLIVFSNEAGGSCGDTATITFNVVSCPGNITGRVKTSNGTGIGGVTLRLFNDTNYDGISDGGTAVRTVTTTATGSYSMVSLTPGQYVIVETQPANYYSLSDGDESDDNDIPVSNNDPNDDVIPVTMEPQEIDADNVFIEAASPGIINGYVFEDFDNDGVPDAAEGIQNVTINLHPDVDQNGEPDAGAPLATVTTSNLGFFTFGDVSNGDYVIIETQPSGFNNVQDLDATNDEDVVPNTNQTDDIIPVTIANSETDSHNFFKESSICSHVVASVNDNGPATLRYIVNCADSGDTITFHTGLAGAVIHLTSDRIVIDKNIYIHSTLNPRVRIHSDVGGAFKINAGITAEFKNLNFTSGLSGFPGAAFENYGHLILWDAQIIKNLLLLPGNYLIYNGTAGMVTTKGGIQIEFD